jgi:hypothetical protein
MGHEAWTDEREALLKTLWASIGLAAVMVLGWIVEAGVKWAVSAALSHFQ